MRMNKKEYTLYFKGKNKYGHLHELPIATFDLKTMDFYTCNYINYIDLLENLPVQVKQFIKSELSNFIIIRSLQTLYLNFFPMFQEILPIQGGMINLLLHQ